VSTIDDIARHWNDIEPLLDQVLDLPDSERVDWLRRQDVDATLRALVAQALDDASPIDGIAREVSQWLVPAPAVDAFPALPGYRVRRFVGAGGMASVFEAERDLPGGAQTVALKLLRIDVHDPDERRRFLREQGILARLRHPHIAQLLDAGFTPTGTPFLAIEFVAGEDVLSHCRHRELDVRSRLRLFVDICKAVEHAHRNLIVHRDLKPGNVLVDDSGCVKLVDFGIAKLLGDGEETGFEARRLTRRYAAPEQFTQAAATTAIDVHALGLLLAELCGLSRTSHGGSFAFDAAHMRRVLNADIHAIVGEATHADPHRRYADVAALRADIEQHLQGQPISVRGNTFAYRAVSFIKRHTIAVAGGAACAIALIVTTAISLHEADRARRAASIARAQMQNAQDQTRRTEATRSFLEGLFDSTQPGADAGRAADELLARGHQRAERDFDAQPAMRVEILALVGDLERRNGHPDRAWQPLQQAADLANAQFGAADRRTLNAEYLLAKDADELGRVRDATARLRKAIAAFGDDDNGGTPEQIRALAWLAGLDERIGASASAIRTGERALAMARRIEPSDSAATTEAVLNLGWILDDAGRADRAEPLLREALARKRLEVGDRHGDTAYTMAILATALTHRGRYDEAERLLRDALDIDTHIYTHPHPRIAWHLNDLANVLTYEGRFDEASALYAQCLAMDRVIASTPSASEATTRANLARLHYRQGDYVNAESEMRSAIDRKQAILGDDYVDNGRSRDRASLAEILIARGDLAEAHAIVGAALSEARHRHDSAHPDIAFALTVDAERMQARGDRDDARVRAGEAVAMYAELSDFGSDAATKADRLFAGLLLRRTD